MRRIAGAVLAAFLAACAPPPKPFEAGKTNDLTRPPDQDNPEVTVALAEGLPPEFARALAHALSVELQSYGILAGVAPTAAPRLVTAQGSARDDGPLVEIEVEWRLEDEANQAQKATSRTRGQVKELRATNDLLISRIAQQAAPRIATLMGRAPAFEARAPGQVAAGVGLPPAEPEPMAEPTLASRAAGPPTQAKPPAPRWKVMVGSIAGAPSDGGRHLASGMRRALGMSRVVVIDKPASDTFTVTATVTLAPIDERTTELGIVWILKDPRGVEVGKVEQVNPVPSAATRGTWAGFGDIVAAAAVEGILELLAKAQAQHSATLGG